MKDKTKNPMFVSDLFSNISSHMSDSELAAVKPADKAHQQTYDMHRELGLNSCKNNCRFRICIAELAPHDLGGATHGFQNAVPEQCPDVKTASTCYFKCAPHKSWFQDLAASMTRTILAAVKVRLPPSQLIQHISITWTCDSHEDFGLKVRQNEGEAATLEVRETQTGEWLPAATNLQVLSEELGSIFYDAQRQKGALRVSVTYPKGVKSYYMGKASLRLEAR